MNNIIKCWISDWFSAFFLSELGKKNLERSVCYPNYTQV